MAGRSASFPVSRGALAPAVLLLLLAAAGCSPDLSPNTYNSAAVQQANKAEQGVVVGVRAVDVRVSGATGAVVGGAAGGIAGSQIGNGTTSAFGALGGSLIGGLLGAGVERAAGDTTAYEYIVRKTNKDLVSVTQKDNPPLALGQRVLVIAGSQARIVPDYTVSLPPETPESIKQSMRDAGPVTPLAGSPPPAGTPAAATPAAATPAAATPAAGAPTPTPVTSAAPADAKPADTAPAAAAAPSAPVAAPPEAAPAAGAAAAGTIAIPLPKAASTPAVQAATAAAAEAATVTTQAAPSATAIPLPTNLAPPVNLTPLAQ